MTLDEWLESHQPWSPQLTWALWAVGRLGGDPLNAAGGSWTTGDRFPADWEWPLLAGLDKERDRENWRATVAERLGLLQRTRADAWTLLANMLGREVLRGEMDSHQAVHLLDELSYGDLTDMIVYKDTAIEPIVAIWAASVQAEELDPDDPERAALDQQTMAAWKRLLEARRP